MALFDECSVFIPAPTLEDFPADASDSDARSMLAGWTALWDPRLIAATEQLPTWYRADSPPEPDGPRMVVVPDSSFSQLPSDFEAKCKRNKDCLWITGSNRAEMLQQMQLGDLPTALSTEHRTISVNDFYAAGYCALQIQIMTRRLRYTSNLDEIHLQKQAVEAAKAFLDGDATTAASALHNVFDCLAEERDHYFSSDPYLIDLTLLTPATLISMVEGGGLSGGLDGESAREHTACLHTPQNVLVSSDVAQTLKDSEDGTLDSFRKQLQAGSVGWAGGAPPTEVTSLDAMSYSEAEAAMQDGWQLASDAVGTQPIVFGRFSGSTPSDMTSKLVSLGYVGMIPIDFANGTGHGEEAKVIQKSGGAEIESLTAKPIDAAGDAAFLSLGARLGEAIDSGEIATGLFAHWPGQGCDSFQDLRLVASWCLALGKFWKLDDYFREGEHPYHHGTSRSLSTDAAETLKQLVANQAPNPISNAAVSIRESFRSEASSRLDAMSALVAGKEQSQNELTSRSANFVSAVGGKPSSNTTAAMVINPSGTARRQIVTINGNVSSKPDHIYAVSQDGDKSVVSVDVPAYGFATVQKSEQENAANKGSLMGRLLNKSPLFGNKQIAEGNLLKNEFMEVAINEETGGIQGVYSGGTRGNRFSMRLVQVTPNDDPKTGKDHSSAKCKQLRVVGNTAAFAAIEATGTIHDQSEKAIGEFLLRYELERGSRFLKVSGDLNCAANLGDDPWKGYIAARGVVASEAAIMRVMVRDKIHRARSRRMVSPLGVVIDEAERQTLVSANGRAYHRRAGDRFLDTILSVQGQNKIDISLCYGFDVSNPIGSAKALISPPEIVNLDASTQLPPQGWIAHVSPADVAIVKMNVTRRNDGLLAAVVRVMQTRNKSASLSVRFCRDVQFATIVKTGDDSEVNQELPSKEEVDADLTNLSGVKSKGDAVRFTIAGHQVADILVVFKA